MQLESTYRKKTNKQSLKMDFDEGLNLTKEATQKVLDKLIYNK